MNPVYLSFLPRLRFYKRAVKGAAWGTVMLALPAVAQDIRKLHIFPENFFPIRSEDTAYVHKLISKASYYLPIYPDSALPLFEKARQLSRGIPYPDGICVALNGIGRYYADRGEQEKALFYLRSAEMYCKNAFFRARSLTVSWYQSMAVPYTFSGRNDSAIYYLYRSLEYAAGRKDTQAMLYAYNNLGAVWINNDDLYRAAGYLKKGEQLALRKPYVSSLAFIANNLSFVYNRLGDTAQMLHYLHRATEYARLAADKRQQQKALLNWGNYYLENQQPAKALGYLEKGLGITGIGTTINYYDFHYALSNAWYQLGNFRKAYAYGMAAEADMAGKQFNTFSKVYFFSHLAEVCDKLGYPGRAYQYQKQSSRLSDSLNQTARKGEIDRLEAQYRLSEHEKELAYKENQLLLRAHEIRNRNIWIAAISIGALGITALLLSLYRSSRRRMFIYRQQKEIDELKAMIRGEE